MQRKPNPRALAAALLAISAALSVAILAVRNLYDDEISALDLIASPVASILRTTAAQGVHPPGMYLLAHLAYRAVPSFRWMDLFPCLFVYAGLAIFLDQVTPLFARTRSQLCLLLLATLHPQLLLWNTTFRWYSWWTGFALVTLTIALQPRSARPTFGAARALALAVLLGCLFYLNYITLLFVVALGAAMLRRYRAQPWKRLLLPVLLILGVFCALIAPQLHTMIAVHIPDSADQRFSLVSSFLRLLQSVAMSEAYLPWHPLAILAGLLFAALCVVGLIALMRLARRGASTDAAGGGLASLLLFGLLFFLLVAVSGLGGKPRNGLLLIPVLAPASALIVGALRPRVQNAILLFLALWSAVGTAHIIGRYGLAKASMNDRPEQVVAFVRQTAGPGCAIVVTRDVGLAFSLAQANLPRALIVSPFLPPIFGGARSLPGNDCAQTRLYAVQSYLGASSPWTETLGSELESSTRFIHGQPRVDSFSFDPDARRKRSLARIPGLGGDLASAAALPDFRYVVTSGPVDRTDLEAMRKRLPDFFSSDDVISR
ncbi:MAG: hypothetical protein ABSG84_07630 [Acidobacteriaceae bacterium]|jgi:hypothetical protein